MDNTEATPPVAGESVTTERGASGPDWSNLQKDYERLGSFKAVAKAYGVAPATVTIKAKELGVVSLRRWRATNLDPGELRRLYEDGMTVPELAKQFMSSQSSIYLRLWMAGTEMRSSGRPGGWKWGPEEYEKRRLATERGAFRGAQKERFRRMGKNTPKVNSPSEVRLQQALIRAGIGFETQLKLLGRYWPDILVNQKPVIIEADSWPHQKPENAAFDKRRDDALREAGYQVIRFTNKQLETDAGADECVRRVIRRYGLLPEVNPVFKIRDRLGSD